MLEAYCNYGALINDSPIEFTDIPEQVWYAASMNKQKDTAILNVAGLYTVEFYCTYQAGTDEQESGFALFANGKELYRTTATESDSDIRNVSFKTRVRCGVGEDCDRLQIRSVCDGTGEIKSAGLIIRFLGHNT